jgi:hypothetical protein
MRVVLAALAMALALAPFAIGQNAPQARMFAPNVISTLFNEFGGVISPDGQTLFFSASVQPYYREESYMSRRLANGGWSPPQLAPFSRVARNFDVTFSPDGQTILFVSDRADRPDEVVQDYNIYEAHRTADGWSTPTRMAAPISGARDGRPTSEHFASMAADGSIYFSSETREGDPGMAIYVSHRIATGYGPAEKLGPTVNATPFTGEPMIAPDQSFLLFSAFGRPGAPGNWDIWISRRQADGSWGDAEPLGPAVNTRQRDYSPRLEPDGHTLLFASERYFAADPSVRLTWATLTAGMASLQSGYGNLYEIDLNTLGLHSFPAQQR